MYGRADTPGAQFVGNSRVSGARSPSGTPMDSHPPSHFTRAKFESSPAAQPGRTFAEQSGKVHPAAGLSPKKVLSPTGLVDFCRAKCESVPGPGFFPPGFFPGVFFSRPGFLPQKGGFLISARRLIPNDAKTTRGVILTSGRRGAIYVPPAGKPGRRRAGPEKWPPGKGV